MGFTARLFAKPEIDTTARLPESALFALKQTFKAELLKPQYNPLQLRLQYPGYADLSVSIRKFNDTAAFVTWLRNPVVEQGKITGGERVAVSLMLTGIDTEADASVVEKARVVFPNGANFTAAAENEVKPCVVALCMANGSDPFVFTCIERLAEAFFDQFGTEGNKDDFDAARR